MLVIVSRRLARTISQRCDALPGRQSLVPPKMQKELPVAGGAGDRRGRHRHAREAACRGVLGDAHEHRIMNLRIGDDAVLTDLLAPRLELWLHESHDVRARV